jgi:Ca2+-transporting ATPase
MDPGDPDVMKIKPRPPEESFFAHGAGIRALTGGILIGLLTMLAFWYGFSKHGYSPFDNYPPENILRYARTMAFMTIISCQLFYSLAFRNSIKSIFQIGVLSNKYLIGTIILGLCLQFTIIRMPGMRNAFKLQMLDFGGWITVILLGLIPLLFNEIGKIFLRFKEKNVQLTG